MKEDTDLTMLMETYSNEVSTQDNILFKTHVETIRSKMDSLIDELDQTFKSLPKEEVGTRAARSRINVLLSQLETIKASLYF